MAIIHIIAGSKPEVLLNCLDDSNISSKENVTISFHKRVHGSVDLTDSKSAIRVNMAREEISELIY
jgi:hypothetical protein